MNNLKFEGEITLTLNQLLTNPAGKSTSYLASRESIRRDLENRFYQLVKQNGGKLDFKVYRRKNEYVFLFKIPSEKYGAELFYDVTVLFFPTEETHENDRTLSRYNIQLHSNSPSFMFTYAYVLNKNELIPSFLKDKCNERALNDPPVQKNPVETFGYEKSIYFAALYIKEFGLMEKFLLDSNIREFSLGSYKSQVASDDQIMARYNKLKTKGKTNPPKNKNLRTNTVKKETLHKTKKAQKPVKKK